MSESDIEVVDVKDLIKMNSALYSNIDKFAKNLKKTNKSRITKGYLGTRRDSIITYWKTFQQRHDEIIIHATDNDEKTNTYFTEDLFSTVEELYFDCSTFIADKLSELAQMSPTIEETSTVIQSNISHLKLPRIELPKFDGNLKNWCSFRDLFTTAVHNNNTLDPVNKLQYLKSCLKGEAENIIRHLQLTSANYCTAWNMLIQRFENKRILVDAHLKRLIDQPNINHETPSAIKQLLDISLESLYSLKNLEIDITSWDVILVFIILRKLPRETHELWEQQLRNPKDLPEWEGLIKFLENRSQTLELLPTPKSRHLHNGSTTKSKSFHIASNSNLNSDCILCHGSPSIRQCDQFKSMTVDSRCQLAKNKNLCTNCLSGNHTNSRCKSDKRCVHCKKRHHSLLHMSSATPSSAMSEDPSLIDNEISNLNSFVIHDNKAIDQILLATAIVKVKSSTGEEVLLRALLDQGSQASFVTETAAQRLHLKRLPVNATISGIGAGQPLSSKHSSSITVNAHFEEKANIYVDVFIMKSLTEFLPSKYLPAGPWDHTRELKLADPHFSTPERIDLLLGADVYGNILLDGLLRGPVGTPIAQKTKFGWILSGQISNADSHVNKRNINITAMFSTSTLNNELKRFWELEEIPTQRKITQDEEYCEKFFDETHNRQPDGRFVVKLPFKQSFDRSTSLGQSRSTAFSRLKQLEQRFVRAHDLKMTYTSCINEYINLEHAQLIPFIPETDSNHCMSYHNTNTYYLPHHAVVKESSKTTKVRIVFDASCKTTSGSSLNDWLLVGPRLQDDVLNITLRWRRHRIVLSADIEKMYRQIRVHEDDIDYQRILWRINTGEQVDTLRLLTVTFGLSCAPYLAVKSLQQLARDESIQDPLTSEIILNDFYVDDLLTGTDTIEEAAYQQRQLRHVLSRGGFILKKWASNCPSAIETIPQDCKETSSMLSIGHEESIKTLGLYWHPAGDYFQFKICSAPADLKLTKRTILSDIAKVFDPDGWLTPVTITAKILIQNLWLTGQDWDDILPANIQKKWINYRDQLSNVQLIKIPRWIGIEKTTESIEYHCFSDASIHAYAAVIYIRFPRHDGTISVKMLASKTKVAPIKPITLPRLELCGVVLGAKLSKRIQIAMKLQNFKSFAWTDSTIVLSWLNGHPNRWKTFVANRVVEVHNQYNVSECRYVPTRENPADCATRGMTPKQLLNHNLWWAGPTWLHQSEQHWPMNPIASCTKEEEKHTIQSMTILSNSEPNCINKLIKDCSSYTKLIRSTAYVLRFTNNAKRQSTKLYGWLSTTELNNSLLFWIKESQSTEFHLEKTCLKESRSISTKSKLLPLNPFLDSRGILRVGGRLRHSSLTYESKYPIILPNKNRFTELLILKMHQETLHGGPQLIMSMLRKNYWILSARSTIRSILFRCIPCYKNRPTTSSQIMGQLPISRVTSFRPFQYTGVDYAGPIDIKQSKRRNASSYKGYLCVFVCMSIKAVHLEIVTELTTDGFMAAFRRFISRRGLCSVIYSDCGSNFVGSARKINENFKRINLDQSLAELIANDGTKWSFIPPSAPHFGGLWESAVKSAKNHLKRVMGHSLLTYEELSTLVTQIEAILNSRPLCPVSNDPSDLESLTPGHFLIGNSLIASPEPVILDLNEHYINRWKKVQQMQQSFWRRWKNEYLSQLQQRSKWLQKTKNICVNDMVIVKDDRLPPTKWLLGRIKAVYPGKDNLIRVATVQTKNGIMQRPIAKLCILPLDNTN